LHVGEWHLVDEDRDVTDFWEEVAWLRRVGRFDISSKLSVEVVGCSSSELGDPALDLRYSAQLQI